MSGEVRVALDPADDPDTDRPLDRPLDRVWIATGSTTLTPTNELTTWKKRAEEKHGIHLDWSMEGIFFARVILRVDL